MSAKPPFDPAQVMRQGWAAHQQGRLDEAERAYRQVLTIAPAQPDAMHFLGVIEAQRGRLDQAVALFDKSLALKPNNGAALYNRANALRGLKRYDECISAYARVLALKPDHAEAMAHRGTAFHGSGKVKEALADYDRALAINPNLVAAHFNRAKALEETGRTEDALAAYDRASKLDPSNAEAHLGRAHILAALNRHAEAVAAYDKALAVDARNSDALMARGNALASLGRFDAALSSFDAALSANGADTAALYGRAFALVELKRQDEAIQAYETLLRHDAHYPYGAGMLLHAKLTACDWNGIEALAADISAAVHAGQAAAAGLPVLSAFSTDEEQFLSARILARDKYPAQKPLWRGETYCHARIRVAYLSGDFRGHAVAQAMAGIFEHHSKDAFEITAVSFGAADASALRSRIEHSVDRFADMRGKSDAQIADWLRDNEIDIAIDLMGLTSNSRLGILAHRPAPVQASFLGFAGTTGADYIDYLLADQTVILPEQQSFFSEKIVYLPDSYMPFDDTRRIGDAVPSRSDAGLPPDAVVFACFNNSYKFSPSVFGAWMRILTAVPGSVLWLPDTNAAATHNLKREAAARGVAAERLVFAPFAPSPEAHLARLRLADLFLDTLPYNAHSTAIDALCAGLPVLTCVGQSFAGRVGASLLKAAGLAELIAQLPEKYEAMAIEAARDPERLAAIKTQLGNARRTAPLFDTARFTRRLEAAFRQMWIRAEAGEAPQGFAVTEAP